VEPYKAIFWKPFLMTLSKSLRPMML